MPRVLSKISNPQEDMQRFNDNFDRISLDIADRSGTFSSEASFSTTIASGVTQYAEINVTDLRDFYVEGKLPFLPRYDVYVDVDDDLTYIYPAGANISQATLHGVQIEVFMTKTTLNIVTNEKATLMIIIRNRSASSHDFYVYMDGFYLPAPDIGVARRAVT